jgi:hypothetical protein
MDPNNTDAMNNKGNALFDLGYCDEDIKNYD